jgi:hypothetical protein
MLHVLQQRVWFIEDFDAAAFVRGQAAKSDETAAEAGAA